MRLIAAMIVLVLMASSAAACDGLSVMGQRACVQSFQSVQSYSVPQVQYQAVAPVVQYQEVAPVVQYQLQVQQPVVLKQRVVQQYAVQQPVILKQQVVKQKVIQRQSVGPLRRLFGK